MERSMAQSQSRYQADTRAASTKMNSQERVQFNRGLDGSNQQMDQDSVLKLGTINHSIASHQ